MKKTKKKTNSQTINKNTYYGLSPYFLRACHSVSRAVSGRYKLTKKDETNGFYITLKESDLLVCKGLKDSLNLYLSHNGLKEFKTHKDIIKYLEKIL